MFKKLQRKILFLNMTLISVVMLLAFATVYATTWQSVQAENLRKLNDRAPSMVSYIENNDSSISYSDPHMEEAKATVSHTVTSDYSLFFLIEVDNDGNVLRIDSIIDMPQESYAEAVHMAFDNVKDNGVINLENKEWMYKIDYSKHIQIENGIPIETITGRYILFLDVTESRQTMRNLLLTLLVVAVAVLVFFYLISLFFSRRVVKPIAESWQKQRQFVADASHELKTPLSIIISNCDAILESKQETVESQIKWFDYINVGTDRMSRLINQLLSLAELDDIGEIISVENVDVTTLVQDTVRLFEAISGDKNKKIVCNIQPGVVVKSDKEKVAGIMSILLDNAVKYSDGYIDVSLKKTKRHVCFTVKNDGEGISQDDVSRIFDRFYRGDKSRAGNDSYGLGLSIAKALVASLDGSISVENKPDGYTVFTVELPAVSYCSAGETLESRIFKESNKF